ncbi:MAG: hypothetical protein IKH28_03015 [Lachnospiraceae bacterium]|nr:hypothetical protein [Lachnospiraceae bacterium]
MILLFVIVCALIILAFSAMMQPGRTKASAARVSGQPRPQRAPDADGRTTPPRTEGTPERKPGRKQGTTRARTRRDGRRQHAEKLPTAKTESYTQPPRAETIHGSRALDGPKTTSPKPQNPPKSTDQQRIIPQKPPDPVSIFSIFRLDFRFFSIFSRFSAVSIPSPSRFFSIQPADLPKISRFFRPKMPISSLPQLSHNSHTITPTTPADFSRFLAPRPSCHFLHFVL